MFKQLHKQIINTRRRVVNNNTVKHVFSIKKKIQKLQKSVVKRLFSVKCDLKINMQTSIIVVTKSIIINESIVKLLSSEFNHVQHSN